MLTSLYSLSPFFFLLDIWPNICIVSLSIVVHFYAFSAGTLLILPPEPFYLNQRNYGLHRLELYTPCFFTLRGSLVDWCRGSFAGLSMRIVGRSLPVRNIADGSSFCPARLIFMNSESSSSFVGGRDRQ